MSYTLPKATAFDALIRRVKGGYQPVTAVFRMPTTHKVCMEIVVDGVQQEFYFTVCRDGSWEATTRHEV